MVIFNTFFSGMWTPTRYTANIHVPVLTGIKIMYGTGNVFLIIFNQDKEPNIMGQHPYRNPEEIFIH